MEAARDKNWETGINPLTVDQNLALFTSIDRSQIVELLKTGLGSL